MQRNLPADSHDLQTTRGRALKVVTRAQSAQSTLPGRVSRRDETTRHAQTATHRIKEQRQRRPSQDGIKLSDPTRGGVCRCRLRSSREICDVGKRARRNTTATASRDVSTAKETRLPAGVVSFRDALNDANLPSSPLGTAGGAGGVSSRST